MGARTWMFGSMVARLVAVVLMAAGAIAAAEPQTGPPDMNALARIEGLPPEAEVFANRPGFCLDLGCGDGALAAEIARRTKLHVFALARNDGDCRRARQTLDEAGVYGRSATAVAGSLHRLPLPDHYGNLIVTGDFQDGLDLKEVARVLNPNGLAVIGGGAADAAKLKAALDAAGIAGYRMQGNYAIFRGRMPQDADDWTHFAHDAGNIQTCRQTSIRPPFRTQWYLASPAYDDKAVQHAVIAGGRILFRPASVKPNPEQYYAFDTFNGALLWTRVAKGRNNYRLALVDGVLYGEENDTLVAMDPATGRVQREYRVGGVENLYWWWLAVESGTLYGLAKDPAGPGVGMFGECNLLVAFDAASGRILWKHPCKAPVLMQTAALDGKGGLFFCSVQRADKDTPPQATAFCLDAATGQERWHADVGRISANFNDSCGAGCIEGRYVVWCCQDEKKVTGAKAFDGKSGALLKEYPGIRSWSNGYVVPLLFVDGRIYSNWHSGHDPYQCTDLLTGEKVPSTLDRETAKGYPGNASRGALYSGSEGFCVYDLPTGRKWSYPFIRPSDFSAPYPAEGLLVHLPAVCHCPHMFGAPMAMAPAGQDWRPPEVDEDLAARLVTGPAFDRPLAEDGKDEWSHYRGNAGHSGEAAAAPKMPLKAAWQRDLGGRLTPPSFGAGLAFVASREAAVWAVDQRSGEVRWRFLCGAGVRVTPAYGRGRILFGSDDGWVYCLDAKTGELAWRFRAAPQERYINGEGQMNSLWPSTAGVVLDGTTAYCAAGFLSYDGAYLYALDIATGKPVWAKRVGGPDRLNGCPEGIMALAGDTLVLPVFQMRMNSAYRKADGEPLEWFSGSRWYWTIGSEAVADGDVYFYGGPRHSNDGGSAGVAAFVLMDMAGGWPYGKAQNKQPPSIAPINVAPVLGRQVLLGDGVGYDRAKYCQMLQSDPDKAKAEATLWSAALWSDKSQRTSALALAGDVALAAGTSEVVAFEAGKDARELARVQVPGVIRRNSLAVAGGAVFVVTEQGSLCRLGGD